MVLFYFFILCERAFFLGVLTNVKQCFLRNGRLLKLLNVSSFYQLLSHVDTRHPLLRCGIVEKRLCTDFHLKNNNIAYLPYASFFKALNQFSAIPRLSPMDSFRLLHAFHREKTLGSTPDVVCFPT